ncbi:MAG: hypothetical protein K2H10_02125, partial [Bacteroidales bacterium]|nr:hypothetical protein [Bacteroidales bacterium]
FFQACELSAFDTDKRQEFEANRMREIDYYSIINTAKRHALAEGEATGIRIGREEGREEGRKEGIEIGRTEGESHAKLEIARTMKARGMSDNEIAEITGISIDDIRGI